MTRDGLPTGSGTGSPDVADPHPANEEHYDRQGNPNGPGEASTDNFAKPGEPSDPQERNRPGHDGQPQPQEAAAPPSPDIRVNTIEDATGTPLAGKPVPKGDQLGLTVDADERALKPVLDVKNNRTGGG